MSAYRADRARLEEMPSVLDAEQVGAVLGVSRARVYDLVNAGLLGRLDYVPKAVLVDSREVRRFLREQTVHRPLEATS